MEWVWEYRRGQGMRVVGGWEGGGGGCERGVRERGRGDRWRRFAGGVGEWRGERGGGRARASRA